MKVIFMKPKKAALSIIQGIYDECEYLEWIGPRFFDVWGMPKKKKLSPRDKLVLPELVDSISKTKITFDKYSDIPKIHDESDNLNKTVEIMKANPNFGLQIEGYVADDEGSEMDQRDLAQRRIYMVRRIFIEKGVPENQISSVTYTSSDPQNNQNIPDVSKDEHRAVIFRILVN